LNKNISDKDKQDWNKFVESEEKLPDKDFIHHKKKIFKIRSLDLHGFTLDEANDKVQRFIINSHSENINKLIIVTGKGLHSDNYKNPYVSKDLSILKHSIPEFIKSNQNLMKIVHEIQDAKIEDGGSGAFYVILKKNK
jgi:DNA-nicking Smr family endonuclease